MQPPALNHSAAADPSPPQPVTLQIFTSHGIPRHPRLVAYW
jgi:hypothetical protein